MDEYKNSNEKKYCGNIIAIFVLLLLFIMVALLICLKIASYKNEKNEKKRNDVQYIYKGEFCDENKCEDAILLNGEINKESYQAIKSSMNGGNYKWLCLNSPGGNVEMARNISEILISKNVSTCVAQIKTNEPEVNYSASCSSSCSELWFNGLRRTISSENSYIGLHQYFIKGDCEICSPAYYIMEKIQYSIENFHAALTHPNYREYRDFFSLREGCSKNTMNYIDAEFLKQTFITHNVKKSYFKTSEDYKYKNFKNSANCVK